MASSEQSVDEITGGLRAWFSRKSVPEHRQSIWYYFGGLTLFLLCVMIASGLLLTAYYEPSAAPATAADGSHLVAVRITAPVSWDGTDYAVGDIVPLPYDAEREAPLLPSALKGKAEVLNEPMTGRPIVPSAAWVSVEHTIMRRVEFGSLIRSIHSYSANLLIAALLIHAFSALLMKAYRRPRSLLWVTGGLLLLLVLGFGFTGYLLPWNRLAYFATRVGVSYPENSLPGIGPAVADLVRGGEDVGRATLTRMYSAHVVALPLALLTLTGLHLLLLQFLGLSIPVGARRRGGYGVAALLGSSAILCLILYPIISGEFDPVSPWAVVPFTVLPVVVAYLLSTMVAGNREAASESDIPSVPFYSNYLYRDFLCWLLTIAIVLTLALAVPWSRGGEVGLPVDLTKPLSVPKGIHPEWYFMAAYQLLKVVPGAVALCVMLLVGAIWFAVPWLDRRSGRGERSVAFTALGVALVVGFVGMMVWGYIAL